MLGIRTITGARGLAAAGNKPSKYQALVDALVDLQVATYDFRLSPRGNPQFMTQLKDMVEESAKNSTAKVNLISHSLGGLVVHHFLTSFVSEEWKQQFIQSWIPLAPAYGGTKYTLKQLISGDAALIPWLRGKDVRDQQRSYETSVWLLPDRRLYDGVIVSSPFKNYTIDDYFELFQDARLKTFTLQWYRVKDLTLWNENNQLADPNVTVYPIYGNGVDTTEQLVYSSAAMEEEPSKITSSKGDGVINLKSLQAGNSWDKAQPPLELEGVSHVGILSEDRAIQYIQQVVEAHEDVLPLQIAR